MAIGVKKVATAVLVLLALALWVGNSYRLQQQVGSDDATVQAQTTAIARVVPTPTP